MGGESEKGQRASKKDQRINDRHQRKILTFAFTLGEWVLTVAITQTVAVIVTYSDLFAVVIITAPNFLKIP